jgi:CRISPR-associated exonuclease Cas4
VDEESYLPLSGLNDLLFCRRRCYLHRVEGIWSDNQHTTSGSLSHRRVDKARMRSLHADEWVATSLRIISHRLCLIGICDVVEFRTDGNGGMIPYPVEYKLGRRRNWTNDDVQLCAQALCLEEMLGVAVSEGAIYSIKTKRRRPVLFSTALRAVTQSAIDDYHALVGYDVAPPAIRHKKCLHCSIHAACLPEVFASQDVYDRGVRQLFVCDRGE